MDQLGSYLLSIAEVTPSSTLRLFAGECCHRLTTRFELPILTDLLSFGRRRSDGEVDPQELSDLRAKSSQVYDSVYPGHGAPSASALAISAAAEVAFTDSARTAATQAADFAAASLAKLDAEAGSPDEYDAIFEASYAQERAWQLEKLKEIRGKL